MYINTPAFLSSTHMGGNLSFVYMHVTFNTKMKRLMHFILVMKSNFTNRTAYIESKILLKLNISFMQILNLIRIKEPMWKGEGYEGGGQSLWWWNHMINPHDDVIKWKHFPRYWPFVRGIHRSRWIPRTKASDAELWCFLWSQPEWTVK